MDTKSYEWELRASCATADPEIFFLGDSASTRDAKKVCNGCPVRAECLDANMEERYGVFGGTSPGERQSMGGANAPLATDFVIHDGRVLDIDVPQVVDAEPVFMFDPKTAQGKRDIVRMVQRYVEGETLAEIADDMRISDKTVYRYVTNAGKIRSRAEASKLRREQKSDIINEAIRLYRDTDMGLKAIGKQLGMSHSTVRRYVAQAGVKINGPESAHKRMMAARGFGDETTQKIVQHLKAEKLSVREIAEAVGVSRDKVYNIRKSVRKGVYA